MQHNNPNSPPRPFFAGQRSMSVIPPRPRVSLVMVVDADACTGCGVCEDACQTGAITVADHAEVAMHKCILCCACLPACPEDAIRVERQGGQRPE